MLQIGCKLQRETNITKLKQVREFIDPALLYKTEIMNFHAKRSLIINDKLINSIT